MDDFWVNISRYPRFLISSVLGSILVILTPLKSLTSNKARTNVAFILVSIVLISTISFILLKMTGTS